MNESCILNVESPSYPPSDDERRQCGCKLCLTDLLRVAEQDRDNEKKWRFSVQHSANTFQEQVRKLQNQIKELSQKWRDDFTLLASSSLKQRELHSISDVKALVFSIADQLDAILIPVDKTKQYQCRKCNESFTSPRSRQEHEIKHESLDPRTDVYLAALRLNEKLAKRIQELETPCKANFKLGSNSFGTCNLPKGHIGDHGIYGVK